MPVYLFLNFLSPSVSQTSIAASPSDLILTVMKFLIITATVLYLLFAVIVVRQVSLMDSTVKTSFAPQLKLLA